MFKRSRRKIVAAIMSVLVILWVGTLAVIYAFSYFEMSQQNRQMLVAHADMYVLPQSIAGSQPGKPLPNGEDPKYMSSPTFMLSTFYTVAMTYDGEILEIKNDQPNVHPDEELEALAHQIVGKNETTGTKSNLVFYAADKGGYQLVAFMDNTIIHESFSTLFRYTLIFGGLVIIALFFLAVFLARKIVQPLEESYKKQKQFISDAGHELKTPVSVVSANAELLARELGENQWLSNIQYENERMGMLISQLLELARTENATPRMEQIDFSRLVNGEALPFESVAFEKGLVLNCSVANSIAVEGNSTQLKQIVAILIDNAIRYGAGGNEVRLNLTKERGWAKLSVINEGSAIPEEQREQLFERFYRVDPARNGEEKHYGLGLAIAKAIATAHKGQIQVLCYNGLVEFNVQLPAL